MLPNSTADTDDLIAALAADMRPVRHLAAPWLRLTPWVGSAIGLASVLAIFTSFAAMWGRLTAASDMWLATAAAVLTGLTAALASLVTSVPGRAPWWAVTPLPPLVVWGGANGLGCLRQETIGWTRPESMEQPMLCFCFIALVSAPLSALLTWQIVRAFPQRPALTASLGGLASAAAAASLLTMIHPFDANARDLGMHLLAIMLVVGATCVFGVIRARQRYPYGAARCPRRGPSSSLPQDYKNQHQRDSAAPSRRNAG
jgi:hypothetical protein